MRIGSLELDAGALLAPMAGVADASFRRICRSFGAAATCSELVSADGLVRENQRTRGMIEAGASERPFAVQIFGKDPQTMARAALSAEEASPDWIDLNFGCPAKKVVKNGSGSALLRDLKKLRAVIREVIAATSLPVTGKIRSGWNEKNIVALQAARILQEEGAAAVILHPRTRDMAFKGKADWDLIKQVKESVTIPVIGNGDIQSAGDAQNMLTLTGCNAVMIGRGALGRPWIFRQVAQLLEKGEVPPDPSFQERIAICLDHYRLALTLEREETAVKEMRKHLGWYTRGMPGSTRLRQELFQMTDPGMVRERLLRYRDSLPN